MRLYFGFWSEVERQQTWKMHCYRYPVQFRAHNDFLIFLVSPLKCIKNGWVTIVFVFFSNRAFMKTTNMFYHLVIQISRILFSKENHDFQTQMRFFTWYKNCVSIESRCNKNIRGPSSILGIQGTRSDKQTNRQKSNRTLFRTVKGMEDKCCTYVQTYRLRVKQK
jgi:hypothetical protein